MLSDISAEIQAEFFCLPRSASLMSAKRITKDSECQIIQTSQFTIMIDLCDMDPPIRLTIQDYKVIPDVGMGKLGDPVSMEVLPEVMNLFHGITNNLRATHVFSDTEEASILPQTMFHDKELSENEDYDGSNKGEEKGNVSQLEVSTQVPKDYHPPDDRIGKRTSKAAEGLKMLMGLKQKPQPVCDLSNIGPSWLIGPSSHLRMHETNPRPARSPFRSKNILPR
jgi:hypothetical protein